MKNTKRLNINATTKVSELQKQVVEAFGGRLRIYYNGLQANDGDKLVSIGSKTGVFDCYTGFTIRQFEDTFLKKFNLRSEIFTADDKVNVQSGIKLTCVEAARVIEANLPSAGSIQKYLKKRNQLQNYVAQENAINKVFQHLCPLNVHLDEILIKCSILNDFYSTQIFDVYQVGMHFINCNIDKRLKVSDMNLVTDLANVTISGKPKYFYSFASKYCSHHNPNVYPIFDSYVGKMLTYFMCRDRFDTFTNSELRNYPRFRQIIVNFQTYYNLQSFSLLDIDNYLWLLGKESKI